MNKLHECLTRGQSATKPASEAGQSRLPHLPELSGASGAKSGAQAPEREKNMPNRPQLALPTLAEITPRDVHAMSLPGVLRFLCALQEDGTTYSVDAVEAAQARVRTFADQMEAEQP